MTPSDNSGKELYQGKKNVFTRNCNRVGNSSSIVDKNTEVHCESLEKQALRCSLIFCVWFTFNTLFDGKHKFCELTFFSFLFKDTLLKVVPM